MWDVIAFLIQQLMLWVGLPLALALLERGGKKGGRGH